MSTTMPRAWQLALAAFTLALPAGAAPAGDGGRAGYDDVELVETAPIETTLDHPDIRDAYVVWPEMIASARRTLDIAEFYVSSEPGSRLEPVLSAIEQAGARGVEVRILAEKGFYKTYPQWLDRLGKAPHVTVRLFDVKATWGGILHAKYFVVDGERVYLGSQNMDYRSLSHIQELGLRLEGADVARYYADVFESYWRMMGGADPATAPSPAPAALPIVRAEPGGETVRLWPTMSPTEHIPCAACADEDHLVGLIDGAKHDVRLQALTYVPVTKGEYWAPVEDALRRAAARGVHVRLLLADWMIRPDRLPYALSLAQVPHIEVRLVTIPQWSGGFVPFARVVHAKYLVVDDDRAWVGTSNFEKDYFHSTRNVGVVLESARLGGILAGFFDGTWATPYAFAPQPGVEYKAPRVSQ